jgi:hypothetical protein
MRQPYDTALFWYVEPANLEAWMTLVGTVQPVSCTGPALPYIGGYSCWHLTTPSSRAVDVRALSSLDGPTWYNVNITVHS